MKKTSEMVGLNIISIVDAMERGKVKDYIVDDNKGAIEYIVVDDGIKTKGTNVIPSGKVLGIGEYALTIETSSAIMDINSVEGALELVKKDVPVRGTRVLTKKGRLVGETGDFFVDEDRMCLVAALEFIPYANKEQLYLIPRSKVLTFGKNYIVVEENIEEYLIQSDAKLSEEIVLYSEENLIEQPREQAQDTPLHLEVTLPSQVEEISEGSIQEVVAIQDESEAFVELGKTVRQEESISKNVQSTTYAPKYVASGSDSRASIETIHSPLSNSSVKNTAATLFEQKQRQFLKGKKVTKNIFDLDGNVLVQAGDIIDESILDIVSGSGKMVELVMNNRQF